MKKLFFAIISFLFISFIYLLSSCAVGAAVGKNVSATVQQNDSITTHVVYTPK